MHNTYFNLPCKVANYAFRAVGQAQEVVWNKHQPSNSLEAVVENPLSKTYNGLNRIEKPNILKQAIAGMESGDTCSEADISSSRMDGWSHQTSLRDVQAEQGIEELIVDFGQGHELLREMHSEVTVREGDDLAIVPLECNHIEPIVSVEPGGEEFSQDVGSDWLSDRDADLVSSAWARRKLKGFGKFLGISYGGMEDEAARLFARIEQQWRARVQSRGERSGDACRSKGKRELKNLEWSVSDGRRKGRGRSWPRGLKEDSLTCSHIDFVSNED